jgi:hypothetical protein
MDEVIEARYLPRSESDANHRCRNDLKRLDNRLKCDLRRCMLESVDKDGLAFLEA